MTLLKKLYKEHDKAFAQIENICQNKNLSPAIKASKILKLWDEELSAHFKQEEQELFADDEQSKELIAEHQKAYLLIKKIKQNPTEKNTDEFCNLILSHIAKEENYFRILHAQKNSKKNKTASLIIISAIISFCAGIFTARFLKN